jgi:choline dehydrogenase-like flavoprotein
MPTYHPFGYHASWGGADVAMRDGDEMVVTTEFDPFSITSVRLLPKERPSMTEQEIALQQARRQGYVDARVGGRYVTPAEHAAARKAAQLRFPIHFLKAREIAMRVIGETKVRYYRVNLETDRVEVRVDGETEWQDTWWTSAHLRELGDLGQHPKFEVRK